MLETRHQPARTLMLVNLQKQIKIQKFLIYKYYLQDKFATKMDRI